MGEVHSLGAFVDVRVVESGTEQWDFTVNLLRDNLGDYFLPELRGRSGLTVLGGFLEGVEAVEDVVVGGIVVDSVPSPWEVNRFRMHGGLDRSRGDGSGERWGCVTGFAVQPAYRRSGVGGALLRAGLLCLEVAGCNAVLCESWVHEGSVSAPLLRRSPGWVELATVPYYWFEVEDESDRVTVRCAECGTRCECTAVLFAYHSSLKVG